MNLHSLPSVFGCTGRHEGRMTFGTFQKAAESDIRTEPPGMHIRISKLFIYLLLATFATGAAAQNFYPVRAAFAPAAEAPSFGSILPEHSLPAPLLKPVTYPRMGPELAFEVYVNRSARQNATLAAYTALTTVNASLPDSKQRGQFELSRQYTAPHVLKFKSVRFEGDSFVKVNVIGRLLQSEVEREQKDAFADIAVNRKNYKVAFKKTDDLNGRLVHVFQLKPRARRPGLFKGHIYIDAFTGTIVRAEGRMVKSPSLFIKNIDFAQDFTDVGSFTFPTHLHSEAQVRLIGHVIVNVNNRDYRPAAADQPPSALSASASGGN